MNSVTLKKDYIYKIDQIYMMGGWFDHRPTFNWSLNFDSVIALLQLMQEVKEHQNSPKLTIFSSHFFRREFNGYINEQKFPEIIKAFDKSNNSIVSHLRIMIKNWDESYDHN